MPIYQYDCDGCGRRHDIFLRSLNAAKPSSCPECGSPRLRRAISSFQFHKSAQTKLDELDPKYEKMTDDAGSDLSMDSLIKQYQLDKPLSGEAPDF